MSWVLISSIGLFVLVIIGYVLYLGFLVSKVSLTVPFPEKRHEPSGNQEEEVRFATAGRNILEGRWVESKEKSDKTILFCHELGADLHSWHKYAEYLLDQGFNIFTFNFRHLPAKHDGIYQLTAGQWATVRDVEDVSAAVNYLKKSRPGKNKKIGVFGVSKGANAALVATVRNKDIKAVMTDGAFSTVETLVDFIKKWAPIFVPFKKVCEIAPRWIYQLIARIGLGVASLKLRCRFVSIEHSLIVAKVPIMFIYGEDDSYITAKHMNYLFNLTNSIEELWIVPGAKHNDAVVTKPDDYIEKVTKFFKESLA